MKLSHFVAVIFLALAPVFFNPAYAANSTPISCEQNYALCTSAQCIPDPRNPQLAICHCSHQQGASLGYSNCATRKPYTDPNKVLHLTSTFSLADVLSHKKGMQCDAGPWTNCLDQPCTVNPMNPQETICSCLIVTEGKFFTMGGDCNKSTCSTGFWSAALASQADELINPLKKTLSPNLTEKDLMCS